MDGVFRTHHLGALRDVDPEAECPPCHLSLFKYQKRILKRMEVLENESVIVHPEHDVYGNPVERKVSWQFDTQVGFLMDPRNTGKREVVLAHCARYPKGTRSFPMPVSMTTANLGRRTIVQPTVEHRGGTLVVCPPGALRAWVRALASFPTIRSVALARESDGIPPWASLETMDVVVVSAKMVRGFHLNHGTHTWSRLVIDECDTIDVPRFPVFPNLFAWFLTAKPSVVFGPQWTREAVFFKPDYRMRCVVRSTGYVRDVCERMQYFADPDRMVLHTLCVMTDPDTLQRERETDVRPLDLVPLEPNARQRTFRTLMTKANETYQADPADWQAVCDLLQVRACELDTAIERHGVQRDREAIRHQIERPCDLCSTDMNAAVLWPCCGNATCLGCALETASQASFQVRERNAWTIKCPYCRACCPVDTWTVLRAPEREPESTAPLDPHVQYLLDHVRAEERTLVLVGDGASLVQTRADLLAAFRQRGLRAQPFRGALPTLHLRADQLAHHHLDVVVSHGSMDRGFEWEVDRVFGYQIDLGDFEDLTFPIRCATTDAPHPSVCTYLVQNIDTEPEGTWLQSVRQLERVSLMTLITLLSVLPEPLAQEFERHTGWTLENGDDPDASDDPDNDGFDPMDYTPGLFVDFHAFDL